MTDEIDKPDGYCAWHPEYGYDFETCSEKDEWTLNRWKTLRAKNYLSEEQLARAKKDYAYTFTLGDAAWDYATQAGWRIRPVKLAVEEEG